MKRKFTKLLAAFALLVFMTPSMVGWGQTTWEKATSIQVGDVVVLVTENSNNSTTKMELTGFSNTSTVYGIGTAYTSTPAGTYTFEVVAGKSDGTFAFKHENSYLYWTSGNSLNVNSTLSNNTSWNVSIDGTNSKATITNAANNARQIWWNVSSPRFACYTDKTEGNSYYITTLYKQVSSGGNTPSITASDVNIAYNANGGSISYNISNGVNNGVLTAATTSDWLTLGDDFTSPIGFTCSANPNYLARTATVTLTYKNGDETLATKNVTVTQASNPTGYGSATNPLNVADARAVIDGLNGSTSDQVYATGIVSAIPYAYTANNGITFNMVDNSGDSNFLQAYKCTGTDAPNVLVNDIVVVTGNLTIFGTTYEFAQGCQVVSLTHPVITNPYIEADDVDIAYNATSGEIAYTLNNPVAEGSLSVSENVDWISNATLNTTNSKVTFDCVANPNAAPRSGVVTITYAYGSNSTSKEVTVTQAGNPNVFNNISDITEVGTAYSVKGTVVAINSRGFVMGDGTGYVYYYKNAAPTQSVGDMVTMSGTTGTYGQIIQFTNSASVGEATSSNYTANTPAATVITAVPDYSTGYHLSTYFEFEGELAKSNNNYFITLGEAQIQISYPTSDQGTALTALDGKTVHVKGYFTGINSNSKFTVMLESVEEVVSTTPVINADDINIAYDATSGEIAYTITNPDGTSTLGATTTADWISNITVTSDKVTFTTTTNTGSEDRTATITLSYTGATDKVITVTQGHYVKDYADLPFAFDKGKADIDTTAGLTAHGLGNDYTNSPKLRFDDKDSNNIDDYVILKINERPGVLSFKVKGNPGGNPSVWSGNFQVLTSENGTDWTVLASYDDLSSTVDTKSFNNLGAGIRYIKWTYSKTSGNVAFGDINLAAYVDPSTVPAIDASDVDLAYDATDDYIVYSIDNYQAGTMSANTEATWISNIVVTPDSSDETIGEVTFDVTTNNSTNSRTGIITLTFTFGNSQTVTKDVTVTQAGKPAVIIESPVQLTAAANDNGTIDVTYANFTPADKEINLYDDQECTTDFSGNWFDASFATVSSVTDFNHIDYMVDANTGAARTVYMKVEVMDANSDIVFTVVSITQAAYSAPGTWVACSLADLTPADVFVIVGENIDTTYALPNDGGAATPLAVEIGVENAALTEEPAASLQWNLSVSENGYIFYPAGSTATWLYLLPDSNSGVRIGTGNAKHFTFDPDYNYLTTTETTYQRYIGIYTGTTTVDWRCYKISNNTFPANIAGQTFSFYKKVSPEVSYTKDITGYNGGEGGYYLIASPVASVTPTAANGFITTDYDLYAFDQNEGKEWRNFKENSFNLVSGQGYLYASNTTTQLSFSGQPYNGNGLFELTYNDTARWAGYNLIGNPYNAAKALNKAYYRMKPDGTEVIAGSGNVNPMEGVFVVVTEEGQTAIFTEPVSQSNHNNLYVNLNQVVNTRGNSHYSLVDRVILDFGEGDVLPKFMLNPDNTKLYIPQDGKDYAVVRSEAQGELPVNFKAAENGTYTIGIETENLDVEYLHLIDNLTGDDIDLLATPSYSFEARKNDYASRFRLVFSANAGNNEVEDDFAFISDGNIVIANNGEATLQVIDVLGRVVSSQTINGSAHINANTPGVYVLQLINGTNVKTQKIVVK